MRLAPHAASDDLRRRVDSMRRDGRDAGLLDALLDAVAACADIQGRLPGADEAELAVPLEARAALAYLGSAAVAHRVRELADRCLELMLDPLASRPAEALPPHDWKLAHIRGEVRGTRIRRLPGPAELVGAAIIAGGRHRAALPIAQDGSRLRAAARWRQLPVGCLIDAQPALSSIVRIGHDAIVGDDAPASHDLPATDRDAALTAARRAAPGSH